MKLDEAAEDGSAIRPLRRVWVELKTAEARELFEALCNWQQENARGELRNGWHEHFEFEGNELTIEIP